MGKFDCIYYLNGFEHQPDKTSDYKIVICCYSTKHAILRRKDKDWLPRNQDN